MGHVGGKLPAAAFCGGLFCHIKGQQHRSRCKSVHCDPADVKLILPVHSLVAVGRGDRTGKGTGKPSGAGSQRGFHSLGYHKKFLSSAGAACTEDHPRSGINAQNDAFPIQQNKPLTHVFCDLLKFLGFPSQFPELRLDLPVLLVDASQEGG